MADFDEQELSDLSANLAEINRRNAVEAAAVRAQALESLKAVNAERIAKEKIDREAHRQRLIQIQAEGKIRLGGLARSALFIGDTLDPELELNSGGAVVVEEGKFSIVSGQDAAVATLAVRLSDREGEASRRAASQIACARGLLTLHAKVALG